MFILFVGIGFYIFEGIDMGKAKAVDSMQEGDAGSFSDMERENVHDLPVGDESEAETLSDFLIDLTETDNVTVSVYRATAGRARGAYLFQYQLADRSFPELLDELRDNYNGGEFRAFVYDGRKRIANKAIMVEVPNVKKDVYGRAVTTPVPTPVPAGATSIDLMMMQMREDAAQARKDASAANDRTNNMMLKMFEVMNKPLPVAQNTSAAEIVALITALNGMDKGKGGSMKDTLDMLATAKGLFADGGGDSGGGIVDKLVTAGMPFLGKLAESGAFNPAPVAAPVAKNPVPAKRIAPPAPQDDTAAMVRMMCRAALADADTLPYAEIAIDQLGADAMEAICKPDDNFSLFMLNLPEAIRIEKAEWFNSFRFEVLDLLAPSPDGDGGESIPTLEGDDNAQEVFDVSTGIRSENG